MARFISARFNHRAPVSVLFQNALFLLLLTMVFNSCDQDNAINVPTEKSKIARTNATPLEAVLTLGEFEKTNVTVRTHGSGYHAKAKGKGFIPSGEYAGQRFSVTIEGEYAGLGPATLVSGSAEVEIRSERFESVNSVELFSFCCGEGYINDMGTHFEFAVFGQVVHVTSGSPHNHLFAGFGTTLGTMNFNVADQTGSITEPAPGGPPPHDPGIGLIIEIPAHPVTVEEIP